MLNLELIKMLPEDEQIKMLRNSQFMEEIDETDIQTQKSLISVLSKQAMEDVLNDMDFVETTCYNLCEEDIDGNKDFNSFSFVYNMLLECKNDELKMKYMEKYNISDNFLLESLDDSYKVKLLLADDHSLSINPVVLLGTLDANNLIEFLKTNPEFIKSKNINMSELVRKNFSCKNNLEFVYNLQELGLPESEYKLILGGLENKAKESFDLDKIDEKYHYLIKMRLIKDRYPDLEEPDLSIYSGLDELLRLDFNISEISDEQKVKKIMSLSKIVPKMEIVDSDSHTSCPAEYFLESQEWISSVMSGIDPSWSQLQKMAYINSKIAEKISYTPEQRDRSRKRRTA